MSKSLEERMEELEAKVREFMGWDDDDPTEDDILELEACATCGSAAEMVGVWVACRNGECGIEGPDNDPDGEQWNEMQRRIRLGKQAALLLEFVGALAQGVVDEFAKQQGLQRISDNLDDNGARYYPSVAAAVLQRIQGTPANASPPDTRHRHP